MFPVLLVLPVLPALLVLRFTRVQRVHDLVVRRVVFQFIFYSFGPITCKRLPN